ncbi:anti-sigma factor family protein [Sphingomonas sp. M1A8_2b]
MIPDDAMLMAYVDGELDPLAARRVERAIAADPALARVVASHRALGARVAAAYPLENAPATDPLAALIRAQTETVVPFAPPVAAPGAVSRPSIRTRWMQVAAMAACLALGVGFGTQWQTSGPVEARGHALVASGALARALDTQLASTTGDTRLLLSFRNGGGAYCRVFAAPALDGIACRDSDAWTLTRTRIGAAPATGDYRQAGSADAALMAEAQDMAAGDPLTRDQEAAAAKTHWK